MDDRTAASRPETATCPSCLTLNRVSAGDAAKARCGRCGKPVFDGHPVALDEESFARHAKADTPLLVDFWAPWCGPCRVMAPIYEQAAAQLEPAVRVAKVDTEAQGQLAGRFAIRSIPTLVLFKNGREVARQSGVMQLPQLLAWVREHG